MKVIDILRLDPQERLELYRAHGIEKVIIDGNEFTDYGAFSFLWEKSYVKSPVRSGSGTISNLDSYATFLTPHLKIDFSLMSIDTYRALMKLIYGKNEFTVTCYDVVFNEITTNKMYFSTEEMPKLWTMVEALNGNENAVELLGVQEYTVEMVGTNDTVETLQVQYNLNVPADPNFTWVGDRTVTFEFPMTVSLGIGDEAVFKSNDTPYVARNITFDNRYKLKYWCETKDGTGFKYIDGNHYMFRNDLTLYAIWEKGAQ